MDSMSKQALFNEALQELIEACADLHEAEQPGSDQGSWGKAMLHNVVLSKLSRTIEVVGRGYPLEVGGRVLTVNGMEVAPAMCTCEDADYSLCDDACIRCGLPVE